MADKTALIARAADASRRLMQFCQEGKRIVVVTHIDADGLSSGSIVFKALARKRAGVSVRAIPDLDLAGLERLKEGKFDFYVFTDLASGLVELLSASFGSNFLVVDHHQLSDESAKNPNVLNAWNFGYDGGSEACSSSMAYILALALDGGNTDLSQVALLGALGDRQDSGPGRSLTGLNSVALDDAVSRRLVNVSKDFLFYGRETRPIHDAIALTYTPFIPGLSGAKDAALAALTNAGFKLQDHGRWRTLSELSNDEKTMLMDLLASFVASSENGASVIADMVGEVYSFPVEDSLTPLHDAREFATLLNACGRMDRTDLGIAICLGEREAALSEALRLMAEYRTKLNKAIQVLQTSDDKVTSRGEVMIVLGEEFIEERMTGSISSLLASTEKFRDKLVLVRARSGTSELKFSSRIGEAYTKEVNLGEVMREAAELVGGVGGGHSMAAGAKILFSKRDEFTDAVIRKVSG